ncbi:M56 family metallopeptidase [Paenibacillus hamazuiensis]|uniref:M56 family metallopeptidase n=1 Tax=Paenibacillus hamazuiensis TaxID=2936508 RepID=UPI00200DA18E|nr:M56 family metallopeptidase [Paenibacillus hamazuiensis]
MDHLYSLFAWLCYSTLAASAVVLFIMVIQALFHRHMSPRMRHALWLIVLIRLLLPDFPNSPLSLFNALQLTSGADRAVADILSFETNIPAEVLPNDREVQQLLLQNQNNIPPQNQHPILEAVSPHETENQTPSFTAVYPFVLKTVSVIWLTGAAAILVYLFVYMWRIRRALNSFEVVTDPRIVSIMNDCRSKFGIKKPIALYTGHDMKSPHISGVIHPWIYFPKEIGNQMNDVQLYHIISHELAHYKRNDIAWNWLGALVLAIHWINPIIWIYMKKMKVDMELACDAYVLEVLGEAEAIPYGMTIVQFLKLYTVNRRNQPSLLYFFGANKRNQVVRRIKMITSFKKGTYKLSSIAVLCVAIMGLTTLTNAAEPISGDPPKEYAEGTAITDKSENDTSSSDQAKHELEEVVKANANDTKFNIPSSLPEEYRFEKGNLHTKGMDEGKQTEVEIRNVERKDETISGNVDHFAIHEVAGLEASYQSTKEYAAQAAAEKDGKGAFSPDQAKNELEEVVKAAGFEFKIPKSLPEGYRFEGVKLTTKGTDESKQTEVETHYVERKAEVISGNVDFYATHGGAGLEAVYKSIEQALDTKKSGWAISRTSLRMKELGLFAMKVTVSYTGQSDKRYYVWEDRGVQYQFQVTGKLSDQELITIVSSMKYPNEEMNKR